MKNKEKIEGRGEEMSQLHNVALKIEIAELVDEWVEKFELRGRKPASYCNFEY